MLGHEVIEVSGEDARRELRSIPRAADASPSSDDIAVATFDWHAVRGFTGGFRGRSS